MSASGNRAHDALASLPPLKLFIDNEWVEPRGDEVVEVRNPATGEAIAKLRSASVEDVNRAVASGRKAWAGVALVAAVRACGRVPPNRGPLAGS